MEASSPFRPLKKVDVGVWRSPNNWTFIRHESDPQPKRWFVYILDDSYPANEGSGITTLRDAVEWAEKEYERMKDD